MSVADLMAIETALQGDYDVAIAQARSLGTEYPNVPFAKPDPTAAGSKWARFTVLPADSNQIEIAPTGSRTFRTLGILHVAVFVPLDTGEGVGKTEANAIADRYRGTTRGGCLFRAPTIEEGERDEGWWRVAVRCPFQADMTK